MKDRKRLFQLLTLVFFWIITIPLYSKEPEYPLWYTDDGLEEAFPSINYIRERGEGSSKTEAENDAVSYIARSFEIETQVSSTSELKAVQTNDNLDVKKTTDIKTKITSNVTLFGLQFSDPFYLKKKKKYYVVAYINRTDAWNRYEPELTADRNTFLAFYDSAMKEPGAIGRIKLLSAAEKAGESFHEKYLFASALSKSLTQKTFKKDEQLLASIPGQKKQLLVSNPVFIKINDDNAGTKSVTEITGIIENPVKKAFTNLGFFVTGSQENAGYIAKTEVHYNQTPDTQFVVYNPGVVIYLYENNKCLYTVTLDSRKVVAPTESAAKKIAANDIAELINQRLEEDLREGLGL